MNRYLDHMHAKSPHDRRQHALRVAGALTAVIFVGWVTTLGMRMGGNDSSGSISDNGNISQTAAAVTTGYQGNQLIVSTTTDY